MKAIFSFIWETFKIVAVALMIVIPIRYFLFQPFIVSGQSMEPNFSHGDYLIVDEISYRIRDPRRGEVVVFRFPENPSLRHIKRIIGLPGETVRIGDGQIMIVSLEEEAVYLDESGYIPSMRPGEEKEFRLKEGEYFVMGDNRGASFDSRRWGGLPREFIIGRVMLKVLPLSDFGMAKVPSY